MEPDSTLLSTTVWQRYVSQTRLQRLFEVKRSISYGADSRTFTLSESSTEGQSSAAGGSCMFRGCLISSGASGCGNGVDGGGLDPPPPPRPTGPPRRPTGPPPEADRTPPPDWRPTGPRRLEADRTPPTGDRTPPPPGGRLEPPRTGPPPEADWTPGGRLDPRRRGPEAEAGRTRMDQEPKLETREMPHGIGPEGTSDAEGVECGSYTWDSWLTEESCWRRSCLVEAVHRGADGA
ncbi:unnamed protein product [Gadus morhua 'NCC']